MSQYAQNTEKDLNKTSLAIFMLCEVNGKPLTSTGATTGMEDFDGTLLFKSLASDRDAYALLKPEPLWQIKTTVCDRWEQPILGRVTHLQGSEFVRLWSKGPNQLDEHGDGDGIVVEFEVKRKDDSAHRR